MEEGGLALPASCRRPRPRRPRERREGRGGRRGGEEPPILPCRIFFAQAGRQGHQKNPGTPNSTSRVGTTAVVLHSKSSSSNRNRKWYDKPFSRPLHSTARGENCGFLHYGHDKFWAIKKPHHQRRPNGAGVNCLPRLALNSSCYYLPCETISPYYGNRAALCGIFFVVVRSRGSLQAALSLSSF